MDYCQAYIQAMKQSDEDYGKGPGLGKDPAMYGNFWQVTMYKCPTYKIRETTYNATLRHRMLVDGEWRDYLRNYEVPMLWTYSSVERAHLGSPLPSGLELKEVSKASGIKKWLKAFWYEDDDFLRAFAERLEARHSSGLVYMYLVKEGDMVVGGGALRINNGIAVIENLSTVVSMRRRGIATAVMIQLLNKAAEMGCEVTVLSASPQGLGLYERLGFTKFGQVTCYNCPE